MQQAVKDRGGDDAVAEHGSPLAHGAIAGYQHRAPLVTSRHQLEEQMCRVRLKRQVSKFVHNQELRLSEVNQAFLEPAGVMRFGERGHHRRSGGEQRRVAVLDRFAPEGDGKVSLADSRRAEQQQRITVADPTAGGQLAHQLRVQRGLRRELEALERSYERKLGDRARHLDATLVLARDLRFAQQLHRVEQRELAPRGRVQQVIELIADRGQLQARQHARERFQIGSVGLHQAPPVSVSYSCSGRSSAGDAAAATSTPCGFGRGSAPTTPIKCSRRIDTRRCPAR